MNPTEKTNLEQFHDEVITGILLGFDQRKPYKIREDVLHGMADGTLRA